MGPCFCDRADAGRQVAARLDHYAGRADVVVLGLPRGGVPVAFEVARALRAPLDVLVVRKLRVPHQPELALGAVAAGVRVLDERVIRDSALDAREIDAIVATEEAELARYEAALRRPRTAAHGRGGVADRDSMFRGRLAIVVDDGLATGSTMLAAVAALRGSGIRRTVVAVPVGAPETCGRVDEVVEELVCVVRPCPFRAVGLWYEDFAEVSDERVSDVLARAGDPGRESRSPAD